MEENLSMMMADLSGYTALTEVHGAVSAADLIDRYIRIVKNCLVGDCCLQERVGDEVMIVSASPDFLFATATMILEHTAVAQNFLQVHGGLHYGNVLKRNNSYFGSAVNLVSRIAANAAPGTFWCSADFTRQLSLELQLNLVPKGKYRFKNITGEVEISVLSVPEVGSFAIDPVCRMTLPDKSSAIAHPVHPHLYFCSRHCVDTFIKWKTDSANVPGYN